MPTRLSRGARQDATEPTWRCPECHTVQAPAARCWRCSNPVHVCESCRLYRPSVAADLGTCADDPTGALVSARDARACWVSPVLTGPIAETPTDGLFPDLEPMAAVMSRELPRPIRPATSLRATPDLVVRAGPSTGPSRSERSRLEEAGRAAWVEPEEDRLVDAPPVEPAQRLTTEVQRRRRRWFR